MPKARITPDIEIHYEVDDYTDPWTKPEVVLMMHGNLECGASWYAWVPALARHFKIVRPDMRGYGQSTPPVPADYPWTIDVPIDDFIKLMDQLGIDKFHLIAAKIGGFIARRFAARFPAMVGTLTVVGTPPPAWDRMGVKAAKIAAYIGDMNKYPEKGRERDKEMSKARRDLDWEKQFKLALYPEDAKAIRASRTPEDEATCTMCGDFCASRGAGKLFSGDLGGDKI